jgi:hypothetical protein
METATVRELSLGEMRVGINFNPGGNPNVNSLKQKAADFIDTCEGLRNRANTNPELGGEINRLISIAQTNMETAAMYAVKAATK